MSGVDFDLIVTRLAAASVTVDAALTAAKKAKVDSFENPKYLPAPALTEDAIVAALKADPAMAGRVIARFACRVSRADLGRVTEEAQFSCEAGAPLAIGYAALQSLAVALAAASYRG